MEKTILLTGATDGIGLATARILISQGHHLLLHGRNPSKLASLETEFSAALASSKIEFFRADLSSLTEVEALATAVTAKHPALDVLINNAGVYNSPDALTSEGLEMRFAVNTIAPYLLTQQLMPLMTASSRVVNLSSAAQAPVEIHAMKGSSTLMATLSDGSAYAQSKLALTMWSRHLGLKLKSTGPAIIAVNPGSLLGSKMVKDAFGVEGGDLQIGADILIRAALSDEFNEATGLYFDNDSGQFAEPHADALNVHITEQVVNAIEQILASRGHLR